jgi:MFS family permease
MSSSGYTSLLKHNRNFRALWISQIISEAGDWFNNIAVLGQAMSLTGSGLVVTAILLSKTVPTVLFGPLAGVITDRFSRRTVLLAADYSRALLALGFLLVTAQERVWMSYLFGGLLTAISIFFNTAKSASIPELTSDKELLPANAMTGSTSALVQTMGAALGGFATHWLGYNAAFVINALSFLGSAAMIYRIHFPKTAQPKTEHLPHEKPFSFAHDFQEGMKYIRSNPIVMGLMLIGVGWATGGGAAQILFSLFAVDVFHAGDQGIGMLYSAAGLGIMSGATVANYFFRNRSFSFAKWVLGISIVLTGSFYCFFSYAPGLATGLIWMSLSRVAMGVNQIIGITLLMRVVPEQLRGRVFSTREVVVIFTMVVSMLLAGVGQHYAGLRTIGLICGLLTLTTGLIWLTANLLGVYKTREEIPAGDNSDGSRQ